MNIYFGSFLVMRTVRGVEKATVESACRPFLFLGVPADQMAIIRAGVKEKWKEEDGWSIIGEDYFPITDEMRTSLKYFLNKE